MHILTRLTSSGDGTGESGPASSFILQMEMLKDRENTTGGVVLEIPIVCVVTKSTSSSELSGEGHELFTPLLMFCELGSTPVTGGIYFSLFLNLTGLRLVLTNSCKRDF